MVYIVFGILYLIIWNVPKWIDNIKMDNYDNSKISIGKMAVDDETDPAKVRHNLVNGKYDKDENWKI